MTIEDQYSYRSRMSASAQWSTWYDLNSAQTIIYDGVADTLAGHPEVATVTVIERDGTEMQYRRVPAPVHEVVVRVVGTDDAAGLPWHHAARFGTKVQYVRTIS